MPRAPTPASPATVVLLGWGGATLPELRAYARLYTRRGFTVERHVMSPRALSSSARIVASVEALRQRLLTTQGPLLVHAFSNMGFLVYTTLLSRERYDDDEDEDEGQLSRRVVAQLFDSGPAIPPRANGRSYAAELERASLAHMQGQAWLRRPLLSRSLRALLRVALRLHYALVPEARRAYTRARARYEELAPVVPTMVLHGLQDTVVGLEHLHAWIATQRQRNAGLMVESFCDSDHVQHYRDDPERYDRAIGRFLRAHSLLPRTQDPPELGPEPSDPRLPPA